MKPSLQSKILTRILRTINFRKIVKKKLHKQHPGGKSGFVPKGMKRSFSINIQAFNNQAKATSYFFMEGPIFLKHLPITGCFRKKL